MRSAVASLREGGAVCCGAMSHAGQLPDPELPLTWLARTPSDARVHMRVASRPPALIEADHRVRYPVCHGGVDSTGRVGRRLLLHVQRVQAKQRNR